MTLAGLRKGPFSINMHKNVHIKIPLTHLFEYQCVVEQLAVYLPSIMKVLGLTSWQGVVTVIMLSGSLPCNHKDSKIQLSDGSFGELHA